MDMDNMAIHGKTLKERRRRRRRPACGLVVAAKGRKVKDKKAKAQGTGVKNKK
jgi:hypothetical protein